MVFSSCACFLVLLLFTVIQDMMGRGCWAAQASLVALAALNVCPLWTQSYSSVGQSATLIMWRSAVQVCLGLRIDVKSMCLLGTKVSETTP